jgi:5-(carboxyamino)imidazole ribonucleotide mutase
MKETKLPKVAIVMGSDSDFPVMEAAVRFLKDFEIETVVEVCSAHRTPDKASKFAKEAADQGFDLLIGVAGMAAHLPGVLAAYTVLPVIGVPVKASALNGMDALLSIVQMPPGIPVATVSVDGGLNAAILATQILAVGYPRLKDKLKDYKETMARKVQEKNLALQKKLTDG